MKKAYQAQLHEDEMQFKPYQKQYSDNSHGNTPNECLSKRRSEVRNCPRWNTQEKFDIRSTKKFWSAKEEPMDNRWQQQLNRPQELTYLNQSKAPCTKLTNSKSIRNSRSSRRPQPSVPENHRHLKPKQPVRKTIFG